jgi:hypothetical protein
MWTAASARAAAGLAPNGSHVNIVIGRRLAGAAAAAGSMADVRPGHPPMLLRFGAGNLVRPATVVRNKTTIDSELLGCLTWGAARWASASASATWSRRRRLGAGMWALPRPLATRGKAQPSHALGTSNATRWPLRRPRTVSDSTCGKSCPVISRRPMPWPPTLTFSSVFVLPVE